MKAWCGFILSEENMISRNMHRGRIERKRGRIVDRGNHKSLGVHTKTVTFASLISETVEEDIIKAIDVLNRGGVILYPTDTIWGIGCDATNEEAVNKVYKIKERADSKALIVLLDSTAKLDRYVEEVPEIAYDLIEVSEKPLTVVYDKGKNMAKNLLSEDGSVAIRVTNELFSKTLCARFRRPIVSTSANISGEATAACFNQISPVIRERVDYIVNVRQSESETKQSSSIIKISTGGVIKIIRE